MKRAEIDAALLANRRQIETLQEERRALRALRRKTEPEPDQTAQRGIKLWEGQYAALAEGTAWEPSEKINKTVVAIPKVPNEDWEVVEPEEIRKELAKFLLAYPERPVEKVTVMLRELIKVIAKRKWMEIEMKLAYGDSPSP